MNLSLAQVIFLVGLIATMTWCGHIVVDALARDQRAGAAAPATPSASPAPANLIETAAESAKVDAENARAVERKNELLDRCEKEHGVAVMGYGWKVVCVKPMWVDDPRWPR